MRPAATCIVSAVAALALAAPAGAQSPPSPGDSAASQYVETIPSANGTAPRGARAATGRAPLSRAVARRLRAAGGRDATTLKRIATAPALGAPTHVAAPPKQVPRPSDQTASAAAASAVTGVVSSSRGSRFAVLGLALVAIAAAMILGAFRRNARP